MGSMLVTLGQPLRRNVWHNIRGILDIVHVLPPTAAGIIFYLLAFDAQVREIYVSYLNAPHFVPILCAVVGLSMVSFALYAAHYLLSNIRQNIIYANFLRKNIGNHFRRMREVVALIYALAPWGGLWWGLAHAARQLSNDQDLLAAALHAINAGSANLASKNMDLALWLGFAITIAAAFAVVLLLMYFRRRLLWLCIFGGVVLALMTCAAFLPLTKADIVALYRYLGPLATLSIEILFVLTICTAIAWLSQQSKLPALMLVATAIVIGALFNVPFNQLIGWFGGLCAVFLVLAIPARLWWEAAVLALLCAFSIIAAHRDTTYSRKQDPNKDRSVMSTKDDPALPIEPVQASFEKWFAKRPDRPVSNAAQKKYPVFIIAAQGGGIFAATAASLFLARLQDSQPCFADHVFAISGVSGGAIGATIFQTLARLTGSNGAEPAKCVPGASAPDPQTDGPLTKEIMKIMGDDYFSPVVGAIIPDFVGEWWGRAETLERSLLKSVGPETPAGKSLKDWYVNHWGQGANPALVLNTTSAETGYRVAFAPFDLNDSSDRSLYSFADKEFIAETATEASTGGPASGPCPPASSAGQSAKNTSTSQTVVSTSASENELLMFGAVASARFPFILPPYSKNSSCGRLNFVDGGYADNSGAETALDIYRALKSLPQPGSNDESGPRTNNQAGGGPNSLYDIKLILITGDDPLPDFQQINGTNFGDTLAPISAILQVRKGLGDQAVARVCDYFRQKEPMDVYCNTSSGTSWRLKLVRLEEQAYALPLGWKISEATVNLISSLIGRSDQCGQLSATPKNSSGDTKVGDKVSDIRSNSCVLHDIEQTLIDFHSDRLRAGP